jgi:hypothetical protein
VTLHLPLAEQVVAEALVRTGVVKSASHHLSHSEIASSIQGDVNKKASPSAGRREVFCLDIQPTVCRWLSIAREVLLWIALPFPRFIFSW